MLKIQVEGKEYNVQVADTEESREDGLQNVEKLAADGGMLFVFDEVDEVSFWMKDTKIDLDIIFIDEDEYVIQVSKGIADTEDPHICDNVKYVLEVNADSGIKAGDEVFIDSEDDDADDDMKLDETSMEVLDTKGKSQMDLEGGERIFSRKHTKALAKFAKRAYGSKLDKDYKALGKRIFAYIDYQNNKEEDYVKVKTKKP